MLASFDNGTGSSSAAFAGHFAAPDFQALAVRQLGKGAGCRVEATDKVVYLLRRFAPVYMLHATVEKCCIGGLLVILRFRNGSTCRNLVDNLQQQRCTLLTQNVMQLTHRGIFCNRHYYLVQHSASIHTDIHLHNCYARFLFALDDGVLNRRRTAILRQQRSVYVDAAVFRQLQNFLAQELAEGSYDNQLRLQVVQQLNKFRGFYLLRLVNSQSLLQRIFLNRCLQQLVAASLRTVRLCYYCQNFMLAAFAQRLQAANREIRRSHKYYTHLFSSVYPSFVSQSEFILQHPRDFPSA